MLPRLHALTENRSPHAAELLPIAITFWARPCGHNNFNGSFTCS